MLFYQCFSAILPSDTPAD